MVGMNPTFPRPRSRCVILAISLASAVLTFGSITRADDLPKFSSPEVTAYVKAYSDFTDQYVAAIKASKTGDSSKIMAIGSQAGDMQSKGMAASSKLKPEEVKPYTDYMMKCSQRITDAAK